MNPLLKLELTYRGREELKCFPKGPILPLKPIADFCLSESGQDLIEYALVAALIGLGAILSMKTLATKINNAFTSIGTTLSSNI